MLKPDLQTRILEVLEKHGQQSARDIPHYLSGIDYIALDCGLRALIRANKVEISAGRYALTKPGAYIQVTAPEIKREVCVAVPVASETPAVPAILVCAQCKTPKPECEFQLLTNGTRLKSCNRCHGAITSAGRQRARERRGEQVSVCKDYTKQGEVMNPPASAAQDAEARNLNTPTCDGTGAVPADRSEGTEAQATRPSAAPIRQPESPRERGDNRDVSTERFHNAAAVPETSGSYSRSDPREDARTPASTDIASPRIADRVFERVSHQLQQGLNKVAVLEVALANARSYVAERERFLADYERFGGAAT